ncbi:MAG: hypothetical protein AAF747_09230 [Planctomycetota bacterium]
MNTEILGQLLSKSGSRTSEFWVINIISLMLGSHAVMNPDNPLAEVEVIAAASIVGAYVVARMVTKCAAAASSQSIERQQIASRESVQRELAVVERLAAEVNAAKARREADVAKAEALKQERHIETARRASKIASEAQD